LWIKRESSPKAHKKLQNSKTKIPNISENHTETAKNAHLLYAVAVNKIQLPEALPSSKNVSSYKKSGTYSYV
jgi:hypothetical protein